MSGSLSAHASAVLLRDRGVLIAGSSGAGKTRLALHLIARARRDGHLGRLVGDDQLLLEAANGRLVARAPERILGLCEVPGLGPRPVAAEGACVVDLLVRLVPTAEAPRMNEERTERIEGCSVPVLLLAERDAAGAALAVAEWLFGADAH